MTMPAQNIAAFFDLDGTILPAPSLEWRFIIHLLERDAIATPHVARWLAHFAKNILRSPHQAIDSNKHYLAGINTSLANDWERALPPATSRENSLPLFQQALRRIAWHHTQGHQIFLITGAPAPLAKIAARQIAQRLEAPVEVRATELEVASTSRPCQSRPHSSAVAWHGHSWLCSSNQWTGRLASEHMSNQAKAHALIAAAATNNLALTKSYAYGNTLADIPMLESVGHSRAVNPTKRLAQIAFDHRWPILTWQTSAAAPIPNPHRTRFATGASQ
jgi:phosphoserine phosphatase